jgi:hypothetical protein
VATSVGLLLAGCDASEAVGMAGRLRAALPPGCRAELIVLDDQGDPSRRELFDAVRELPERAHLVPRPEGGRVSELDAMTSMATCELLLFPTGPDVRFDGLGDALRRMWVDGADAAVLDEPGAPVVTAGLAAGDAAGRLAELIGVGAGRPSNRLVVVRRWVARWMLSEVDRALDPVEEFRDRGRLLGLGLAVVPVRPGPLP